MVVANEAVWDRVLRLVIGIAMVYLGSTVFSESLVGAALRIFGFFPIITGLIGWDPVYSLLGFRTRPPKRRD